MDSTAVKERDPRAQLAMRRWEELRQERARFEPDWNDIARTIRPQRGGFGAGEVGDRTLEKPLNSQPITSQQNFAANIFGTLNNPSNMWMGLKFEDPALNEFPTTKQWLWTASRIILASFKPAVSPFYPATIQLYSDIASFGNGAQYDEIDVGRRRFMDVTVSLAEVVWDIDAYGEVSEVVRRFSITAHAAVALFAGRGTLPGRILERADKYEPHKYRFYQHIMRNPDRQPGRIGARSKQWLSRYVCEEAESLISEKGYDDMPFDIARWEVETGFTCGTGPGFVALAAARSVQLMSAATLRAAQNAADPTKLVPDRDVWEMSGKFRPGSFIYGGVNTSGQKMIHQLEAHGNIGLTIEEKREMTAQINDAFYGQLMNLQGRTGVTPLEAMEIQEERMRLMAPNLGRVQHEFLRPKIARRFSMLMKAGQIPPPPDEAKGQPLDIAYQSAAALAQKSAEGAAIMRIFADISPILPIKPRLAERLDDDALIEALHEARGAPPSILKSREEADALSRARAQEQSQAAALAAAESGSQSVRNLAQAAQAAGMGGAPGGAA